jgi:hypothetical protein
MRAKKDPQTLQLGFEPPVAPVIPFRPYAIATGQYGQYTQHIELVEFIYGQHNWTLIRITLAYTPRGWFWGVLCVLNGLDWRVPCDAYHYEPARTRERAIGTCRYELMQRMNIKFKSFPLLRDEPSNKAALAWLKALEVAS